VQTLLSNDVFPQFVSLKRHAAFHACEAGTMPSAQYVCEPGCNATGSSGADLRRSVLACPPAACMKDGCPGHEFESKGLTGCVNTSAPVGTTFNVQFVVFDDVNVAYHVSKVRCKKALVRVAFREASVRLQSRWFLQESPASPVKPRGGIGRGWVSDGLNALGACIHLTACFPPSLDAVDYHHGAVRRRAAAVRHRERRRVHGAAVLAGADERRPAGRRPARADARRVGAHARLRDGVPGGGHFAVRDQRRHRRLLGVGHGRSGRRRQLHYPAARGERDTHLGSVRTRNQRKAPVQVSNTALSVAQAMAHSIGVSESEWVGVQVTGGGSAGCPAANIAGGMCAPGEYRFRYTAEDDAGNRLSDDLVVTIVERASLTLSKVVAATSTTYYSIDRVESEAMRNDPAASLALRTATAAQVSTARSLLLLQRGWRGEPVDGRETRQHPGTFLTPGVAVRPVQRRRKMSYGWEATGTRMVGAAAALRRALTVALTRTAAQVNAVLGYAADFRWVITAADVTISTVELLTEAQVEPEPDFEAPTWYIPRPSLVSTRSLTSRVRTRMLGAVYRWTWPRC
jgi:hypothetical protein